MNALVETVNQIADAWWPQVLHATWQSSLVALGILAMVHLGRRWPGQLRYGILLIALLKFTVPAGLSIPTGLFTWLGPTVSMETATGNPREDSSAGQQHPTGLTRQGWAMLTHALGSLGVGAWVLLQMGRLVRISRRSGQVTSGRVYHQWTSLSRKMGLRREVRLLISPSGGTPVAFGIIRPSVIVPSAVIDDLPGGKAATILAHELGHHRRGDLWVNWVQIAMEALWWFNPLIWVVSRTIRKTREDCCDDLLLARKLTSGADYCSSLLTVAASMPPTSVLGWAPGFAERLHPLAGRIKRIMDPRRRRSVKLSAKNLLLISALAALLLPGLHIASGRAEAKPPSTANPQNEAIGRVGNAQSDLPSEGLAMREDLLPETPDEADSTANDTPVRQISRPYRTTHLSPAGRKRRPAAARDFQSVNLGFDSGSPRRSARPPEPQRAIKMIAEPVTVTWLDRRGSDQLRTGRTFTAAAIDENSFSPTLTGLGIPPVDSRPLGSIAALGAGPQEPPGSLYVFRSDFGLACSEQAPAIHLIDADRPNAEASPTDIPVTGALGPFEFQIIRDDQGFPHVWIFDPNEQGPGEQAPSTILVQGTTGALNNIRPFTEVIVLIDGPIRNGRLPAYLDDFTPIDPGVFMQTSTLVPDPLTIFPLIIGGLLLASRRRRPV